jgi:hypothetical protein
VGHGNSTGNVLPSNIYLADGKWIAAHMFTITHWKDSARIYMHTLICMPRIPKHSHDMYMWSRISQLAGLSLKDKCKFVLTYAQNIRGICTLKVSK